MNKKNATLRSLTASAMALVLSFSMLIGTTFAWFTDSASTAVNTIQSGTLDVALEYVTGYDANNDPIWANAEGQTLSFKAADGRSADEILWEPGCRYELPAIRVVNKGNLYLKYEIAISGIDGDAKLNEAIDWTYTDLAGATFTNFASYLAPNADTGAIVIKGVMREDAGNEYQNLSINGIAITVYATQKDAEFDSFDDKYDEPADYVVYYDSGIHELNASLKLTNYPEETDVVTVVGNGTVLTITGGSYDAADGECAVWAKEGAKVIIEDGTFTHNGTGVAATSASHIDMIYAGTDGTIEIKGGHFEAKSEGVWLLNEKDNSGEITVTGGTFVNWNPANNVSEGANTTFLPAGYTVDVEHKANGDVWYTVVEETASSGVTVEDGAQAEIKDEEIAGTVTNNGDLVIENTTIEQDGNNALYNEGNAELKNVELTMTGSTGYITNSRTDDSVTVFENVTATSTGGGVNVWAGEAIFKSGSITTNSTSTSARHVFYVADGAKLTIEDGEFTFNPTNLTRKGSYICADANATVIVKGGIFHKPSTRTAPIQALNGSTVTIYGGSFEFDPSAFVADGYEAVKSGSTWTVSAIAP